MRRKRLTRKRLLLSAVPALLLLTVQTMADAGPSSAGLDGGASNASNGVLQAKLARRKLQVRVLQQSRLPAGP